MKKTAWAFLVGILSIIFVITACSTIPSSQPTHRGPDSIYTQAAATVYAMATFSSGATAVAKLTEIANANPTSIQNTGRVTPLDDPFPIATSTPLPPILTLTPIPTPVPIPCDLAQFIDDMTVPDGSAFHPGDAFTKTWRLKNIGTCTWAQDYSLVYISGDQLDGDRDIPLANRVLPGQTIDLSIDLVAPQRPGSYTGKWMLRNASGELFGLGDSGDQTIWVQIRVIKWK